jgi:transposase
MTDSLDAPQPSGTKLCPSSRRSGGDQTTPVTAERALLERWVRAGTTSQRVARRSRIVLLALDGVDDIASRVGVSPRTVQLWIMRFQLGGAEALLHDAPGRGRHSALDPTTIVDRLRQANLLLADGHLVSLRRAAAFLEVSPSTVWRALRKADGATSPGSVPPTVGAKQ